MKRLLLLWMLVFGSASYAQSTDDTRVDSLLNHNRIIELHALLQEGATLSPAVQLRAEAIVATHLRQFERSNTLIEKFLNSPELIAATSPEMLSELAVLQGTNFRHTGDYAAAAAIYRNFAEQYEVGSEEHQSLTEAVNFFEGCATQPPTRLERTAETIEIPFRIDSLHRGQMLRIDAEVNGRRAEMIFDTGCAEMSFADELFAREYGLRDTGIPLEISGVGEGSGRLAIADSIRVGGLILRNALFAITPEEGLKLQDGSIFHVGGVLGCNFILAAEVFELDNQTQTIRFPAPEEVVRNGEKPNLWMSESGLFYLESEVNGHPVTMQFDSGNGQSDLTNRYYQKYREEVEASAERSVVGMSGFGGMILGEGYRFPTLTVQVDGKTTTLYNTQVAVDIASAYTDEEEGSFGVDFLMAYPRIRIDYRAMRISILPERQPLPAAREENGKRIESPSYQPPKRSIWKSKNHRAGIEIETHSPVQ